ncbi:hypothetical protein TNCV_3159791 [Trichonephila clavipes]|nr:hypothetical protein TNCV_3159791 [Trichonephila clavipes]
MATRLSRPQQGNGSYSMNHGEITITLSEMDKHSSNFPFALHGTEGEGNILQSPALVIQPTRLSDPLIFRARTPCVLGGYLVASGNEPRPSGLESDALTTKLPTSENVS